MKINIKDLGIITEGEIEIEKNNINIYYGINGTGKSTIANGIEGYVRNTSLSKLKKYGSNNEPYVNIDEDTNSVIVFNQDYVNTYLFKDDIANNSFEIMINTDEYQSGKKRIVDLFAELTTSINSDNIIKLSDDIKLLNSNIPIKKNTSDGKCVLSGSTKFSKARNIPDLNSILKKGALNYIPLLKSDDNHKWLSWFDTGKKFIDDRNKCPFCNSDLPADIDDTFDNIDNSVKSTTLKQNVEIKKIISANEKYMSEFNKTLLTNIINSSKLLTDEELTNLYELVNNFNIEQAKLQNLISLNVTKIKQKHENNELVDFLRENIISVSFINDLSIEFKEDVEKINDVVNKIILNSDDINKVATDFAAKLNSLIENKEEYINDFLKIAGIPYYIKIIPINDTKFKTILKPINSEDDVSENNLSFGEKNAISLMLFSLEANENNDVIILDDPVSSFDNNKKFAILYYIFTKECAVFENKTVILFTHDFDIIVDFTYKNEFSKTKNKCYFLKNSAGVLTSNKIRKKDVKYTIKKWEKNAKNTTLDSIIRIVNLRKYLQYTQPKEAVAIDVLSSLEHNNEKPMKLIGEVTVEIDDQIEIDNAIEVIKKYINNFEYSLYLTKINNKKVLKNLYFNTQTSIKKLQILRMIINLTEQQVESKVFWDYLTTYYHVENNEMTSLDEDKFDVIPDYIMNMANNIIEDIFKDE